MSLIEREALCESLYQEYNKLNTGQNTDFYIQCGITMSLMKIRLQPTTGTGQWIEKETYFDNGIAYTWLRCSVCGYRIVKPRGIYPNYCEHCGADMRKVGVDNA